MIINLYINFSRMENFCWSVVTWTLIRCLWSQLMLWECLSAICSLTSKHLREKGLCSAWDSLAQEAICSKVFITHTQKKKEKRNKTTRSPMKSNGQNSCCIISETSDVEGRWCALNIVLDEKVLFLTLLSSSQQHCHTLSLQKSRCSQVLV